MAPSQPTSIHSISSLLLSNFNPYGNTIFQRQTSQHEEPNQGLRMKWKLWVMQSQILYLHKKYKYAFFRVTSVVLWQTIHMEPWGENSIYAVGSGLRIQWEHLLLTALFSETTSRSWGNTHIWQTDEGRETGIPPFVNSIPVDSLGRTASPQNKHSLWLQTITEAYQTEVKKKKKKR